MLFNVIMIASYCELTHFKCTTETVVHITTGEFCYSEVENYSKLDYQATHEDAAVDVREWMADTNGIHPLLAQNARFGAFVETSARFTCALIGADGLYHIFDSHSHDPRTGKKTGRETGRAVILQINGVENLLHFLRSNISVGGRVVLSQVYM